MRGPARKEGHTQPLFEGSSSFKSQFAFPCCSRLCAFEVGHCKPWWVFQVTVPGTMASGRWLLLVVASGIAILCFETQNHYFPSRKPETARLDVETFFNVWRFSITVRLTHVQKLVCVCSHANIMVCGGVCPSKGSLHPSSSS